MPWQSIAGNDARSSGDTYRAPPTDPTSPFTSKRNGPELAGEFVAPTQPFLAGNIGVGIVEGCIGHREIELRC